EHLRADERLSAIASGQCGPVQQQHEDQATDRERHAGSGVDGEPIIGAAGVTRKRAGGLPLPPRARIA
ncbi:MAG TPA: hypothetical protein VFO79_13860, partial [Xanthomonadales bacterium]|nr:hypothetical protein [Xanthomonadales bacterium]